MYRRGFFGTGLCHKNAVVRIGNYGLIEIGGINNSSDRAQDPVQNTLRDRPGGLRIHRYALD